VTFTERADYLAANPKAARLQTAQISEIVARFSKFVGDFKPVLKQFVVSAESARQIGILVDEFFDTLPGKRMSKDFWQQMRHLFKDANGRQIELEMLEWCAKLARSHPEPIKDVATALQYRQSLLFVSGEVEATSEKHCRLPADPLALIREWFDEARDAVTALRNDQRYYKDGRIREDLKPILRIELEPKKKVVDDFWRDLQS
jgi:hypothetical protein